MECPRCAGSGVCKECEGTGSQDCPVCDGAGQRKTSRGATYACKSCHGTGSIACPPECASCEGSGQITEELQSKQASKYVMKFADLAPSNKVVIPFVALNVLLFGVAQFQDVSPFVMRDDVPDLGHWWAFITASFIHLNIAHVFFNMLFFWFYGPIVEGILGRLRFVGLILTTAVTANLATWTYHHFQAGDYYWSYGASGPGYGLVGAMLALNWRWGLIPWSVLRVVATLAGGFLVLGFAFAGSGLGLLGSIDNWAHIGGALGGFLLTVALPRPQGR